MSDDVNIRPARKADATALAVLMDMASEGMAAWVWSGMARGHETAFEVGDMRIRREEEAFSYRNAFVLCPDRAARKRGRDRRYGARLPA